MWSGIVLANRDGLLLGCDFQQIMVSIYTYLTPLLADEVWHKCILSSFSLGPNLTALEAAILELS